MSRVFDALRKSRGQTGDQPSTTPELFLDTLEKTNGLQGIPVVQARLRPEGRVTVYSKPRGLAAERFRWLRMGLGELRASGTLRTLLLTSPLPQDGKSTVALNLATCLAERGNRAVLLMEADLRRPFFIQQLGLRPWPGLTECLQNGCDPTTAIRRVEPLSFYLLPSGQPAEKPTELLGSEKCSQLMQTLTAWFDWILIDCPPVIPVADTLVLKARADATLLVARANVTPREAVEATIQQFSPGHVIGVILNGVERLDQTYSQYYRHEIASGSSTMKLKGPESGHEK